MELVDILNRVVLVVTRKAVCDLVMFSFDIRDIEVELGHIFDPSPLSVRQRRLCFEEFQGLMIRDYMDLLTDELVLPLVEGFQDGQRF